MSGSIVSARKRSPRRPVNVGSIDKRMPEFYGTVVIPEEQRPAVARLCARRVGLDSEVAEMLEVSGLVLA